MTEFEKVYDEMEKWIEEKEMKDGFHEKLDYFDELYKAAKKLNEESQSLLDWLKRCEKKEQIAIQGKTILADLQDMFRILGDTKNKNLLGNMQQCWVELERHRRMRENGEEPAQPSQKRWNIIGRDGTPMEQQALYLTVQKDGSDERTLMEGFFEDEKWYSRNGVSLEYMGMKVIAWLPRNFPKPYQGNGQEALREGE